MKGYIRVLIVLMLVFFFGPSEEKKADAGSYKMRGVWVSCFEFQQCGLKDKTESEFRSNANRLFANIKESGCNAVFFHVRSHNNAIYSSSVVGWNKYMASSKEGLPYNPLKILVDTAHRHGLKFHAWFNPYRITVKKVLDPAKEKTITNILKQVKEVIQLYNVDGIHFDDYFYPTNQKKYRKVSVATKKKNVNIMIKRVYQTIKSIKPKVKFGISPAGNMKYCEAIGADVKTWMSEKGYVDYIVPQLYWSDNYRQGGKEVPLFSTFLNQWRNANKRDIPMYIGLGLYKAGHSISGDFGWERSSRVLTKQLKKIKAGNTEGYVLFSYLDLYRKQQKKERANFFGEIGKFKLNRKKLKLKKGRKFQLRVKKVYPVRIQSYVKFKSLNKKIATVTKKGGLIKAKKKGTVKIVAYCGAKKKICRVKVRK